MPPSIESAPKEPVSQLPSYSGYEPPVAPKPPRTSKKRLLIGAAILVAVCLAGFIVWKVFFSEEKDNNTASVAPNSESQSQPSDAQESDVPETKNLTEYSNGFLALKLKHPDSWKVSETDNGIRLESPEFSYQTVSKGSATGQFRVYIRKGARSNDSTYIGRGYAIQASEKLVYSDPAPGQRPDTNLTLFGLDEPTNFAYFMIAGNYSLQKGDTLGPTYGKELETYIIAGGFSDSSLSDDLATNQVSPALLPNSNAYSQAIDIVKSLNLR